MFQKPHRAIDADELDATTRVDPQPGKPASSRPTEERT